MSNFLEGALNMFLSKSMGNMTPTQQEYVDVIKNGDTSRGEEIANNLCSSMGVTREQAISQARNFFHI